MAGGLRWTEEQLAEYRERRGALPQLDRSGHRLDKGAIPFDNPGDSFDDISESDLRQKCEDLCTQRGYPFFHDRSRRKNEPGFVDLVIAMPAGRTLWIETKQLKRGRLSPEQKNWRLMLLHLGHEWYEVRTFRQFLKIINNIQTER